jgi:hypothetical protein
MNAPHPSIPSFVDRRAVAVRHAIVGGGLRLLLKGGVLPVGVESLQFVCDLDEARGIRIIVIALHGAGHFRTCGIADELRAALERCFLRCLNRTRPGWTPVYGQVDIWEWSAARPDSLRHRSRSREVLPPPP